MLKSKSALILYVFLLLSGLGIYILSEINTDVDAPSYVLEINHQTGLVMISFQGEKLIKHLHSVDWARVPVKSQKYKELIRSVQRNNVDWDLKNDKFEIWYRDNNGKRFYLNEELIKLYNWNT